MHPILYPRPVERATMEPDRLYIWRTDESNGKVVTLTKREDGIRDVSDDDEWYFRHNIVGSLYGPIELR